ncbi:MAG: ABC transporter permease, partial [Chloroflexi bacterium]|nr:ABC transporter permease [Chloroflexota bacterium]
MFSPRWLKVWRDLWGYKTRTILIVLSIAVGVFAVGMIAGTQVILSRDLASGYLSANPASAMLFTEPFDDELVHAARGIPGVGDAEGRRTMSLRARIGSGEWRTIQLFAIPDYKNIRINRMTPERGSWPPPKGELLLERASLGLIPVDVGGTMEIELSGGKPREMRVAGIVHDLTQAPAFFSGSAYGYITFDTLEWLGSPRDYNELEILVRGNVVDRDRVLPVANLVRNKVEKGGRTVYYTYVPEP